MIQPISRRIRGVHSHISAAIAPSRPIINSPSKIKKRLERAIVDDATDAAAQPRAKLTGNNGNRTSLPAVLVLDLCP
jgi:hypothetical protein